MKQPLTQDQKDQQKVAEAQAMLAQMEALQQQLQDSGQALDLINPDGTPNMGSLNRFLRGKEYAEFRKQYPEETSQIKSSLRLGLTGSGISVAANSAKAAQGLRQIAQAKKIPGDMPQYPEIEQKSRGLARSLSRREGLAERGLTDAERSMANDQINSTYQKVAGDTVARSGGQSGLATAGLQAASNNKFRATQGVAAASAQARAQAESALSQSLGMEQQQRAGDQKHAQYQFFTRDLNLFRARQRNRERLMEAGVYNSFKAADGIFGETADLSRKFREQLPGFVYNNKYYNQGVNQGQGASPLAALYNNPLLGGNMQLPASMSNPAAVQQRYQGGYQGLQVNPAPYPHSFGSQNTFNPPSSIYPMGPPQGPPIPAFQQQGTSNYPGTAMPPYQ